MRNSDFIPLTDLALEYPIADSLGIDIPAIEYLHTLGMVPIETKGGIRGMYRIWIAGLIDFYQSGEADTYLNFE
ncbi:MAG: hypothetical protein H6581_20560 [Bacteroidia bacterium]|nr:hypothetical protein [Bacteroidia bacterium]